MLNVLGLSPQQCYPQEKQKDVSKEAKVHQLLMAIFHIVLLKLASLTCKSKSKMVICKEKGGGSSKS